MQTFLVGIRLGDSGSAVDSDVRLIDVHVPHRQFVIRQGTSQWPCTHPTYACTHHLSKIRSGPREKTTTVTNPDHGLQKKTTRHRHRSSAHPSMSQTLSTFRAHRAEVSSPTSTLRLHRRTGVRRCCSRQQPKP